MTAYNNYFDDFPERCLQLLKSYGPASAEFGREVTLLLAIASAAIIVPFERLRPEGKNRLEHPLGDRGDLGKATKKFDDLLAAKYLNSTIWPYPTPCSWQYATVAISRIREDPEQWRDNAGNELLAQGHSMVDTTQTCNDLLLAIRNGLSHGNIKTLSRGDNAIETLVFLSIPLQWKSNGPATFVAATPGDIHELLKNWVGFLRTLDMPGGVDGEVTWVAAAAE